MSIKKEKAKEYATARYGSNDKRKNTQYEIAKVIACIVGFEKGWDEALKSQFRKCVDNKPLKGQEPKEGENVILLCEAKGKCGYIFPYANTFKNGDWESKILMHYNVLAWMPIPSFDEILKANKDVLERLKNR